MIQNNRHHSQVHSCRIRRYVHTHRRARPFARTRARARAFAHGFLVEGGARRCLQARGADVPTKTKLAFPGYQLSCTFLFRACISRTGVDANARAMRARPKRARPSMPIPLVVCLSKAASASLSQTFYYAEFTGTPIPLFVCFSKAASASLSQTFCDSPLGAWNWYLRIRKGASIGELINPKLQQVL